MNPRYLAWRRVQPDAPLYEFMIWIAAAKRFAGSIRLGVMNDRVTDHDQFSLACTIFAAMQISA